MRFFGTLIFILLAGASLHAEYRVFVLKITKRAPVAAEGVVPVTEPGAAAVAPEERLVLSNLDPEQYRGYYPVQPDEDIQYIKTWKCTGRTSDFKEYCPDPNPPPTE